MVRPSESTVETQPKLQPAFLRLSAMISQYFTRSIVSLSLVAEQSHNGVSNSRRFDKKGEWRGRHHDDLDLGLTGSWRSSTTASCVPPASFRVPDIRRELHRSRQRFVCQS